MKQLFVGVTVSLFSIASPAVGHFTLTPAEVAPFVQQCSPKLDAQTVESEVTSLLRVLNLLPKTGAAKELTEFVELDGLTFRGLSAVDLGIIDILTKHLDAQKSWYTEDYPVKEEVTGNTTRIQRLCETIACKSRNQTLTFSLAHAEQPNICGNALCAMKQIYGAEKGPLLLYAFLKYRLSLTPKTDINADPDGFDTETLTALLTAAVAIPPRLHPVVLNNRHFFRFAKGKTLALYGRDNRIIANANGAVFDDIDDYNFNEKVYIFLHEMGHRAGSLKIGETNADAAPQWIRIAGLGSAISKYSLASVEENFAETFTLYRLFPEKLISASPQRYEFMKNKIFNGVDFRDNLCGQIKSSSTNN